MLFCKACKYQSIDYYILSFKLPYKRQKIPIRIMLQPCIMVIKDSKEQ